MLAYRLCAVGRRVETLGVRNEAMRCGVPHLAASVRWVSKVVELKHPHPHASLPSELPASCWSPELHCAWHATEPVLQRRSSSSILQGWVGLPSFSLTALCCSHTHTANSSRVNTLPTQHATSAAAPASRQQERSANRISLGPGLFGLALGRVVVDRLREVVLAV